MALTPSTNLYLIKCPLTLDNANQLTFSNKNTQYNYFNSLPKLKIEEISYQRKDNIIRYPDHIDNIIEYNYCMYQNDNYNDKWFYAYITNMRYVNDNCTEIQITTDVWQTWQFDIRWHESFVEREHIYVNNDTPGSNLIPEGLETGETIVNQNTQINVGALYPCYVLAYGRDPYTDGIASTNVGSGMQLNGIPTNLYYYVCGANNLLSKIKEINSKGFGDNIITIFTIPIVAVLGNTDKDGNEWTLSFLYNNSSFGDWLYSHSPREYSVNPGFSTTKLNNYTPRNKKLLTYPYCYLGFVAPNRRSKNF